VPPTITEDHRCRGSGTGKRGGRPSELLYDRPVGCPIRHDNRRHDESFPTTADSYRPAATIPTAAPKMTSLA
jgi:hypothetical protein